jgi:hypothetical protein
MGGKEERTYGRSISMLPDLMMGYQLTDAVFTYQEGLGY